MPEQRWVRLSTEKATSAIHILGTELCLDICGAAPSAATTFNVWTTVGLNVYADHNTETSDLSFNAPRWHLDKSIKVAVTMDTPSTEVDEEKIRISYYKDNSKIPIAKAILHITCIEISLDADINRSGTVTRRGKQKSQWTWGPDGKGAILLVNCDRDSAGAEKEDNKDTELQSNMDLKDMSCMILTAHGPDEIFDNHQLVLHISEVEDDKVGVFYSPGKKEQTHYKHVLGSGKLFYVVERDLDQVESVFYVEGLKFPDINFSGLVTFRASLLEPISKGVPHAPIFTDNLVFRVAPWIMTPNILKPVSVYICSVAGNDDFVADVRKLTSKAGCKFIICPEEENEMDQWIQDEMEFGYTQAPHKSFPVVFDSPRNRGLKDFPFKRVLGPDFGYVKRDLPPKSNSSTLDAFGNLDVSPPVKVRGKEYPLGRILIGTYFPANKHENMSKIVQDFLYAQVVQSPIELHSNWLLVGHVDEFLSFVPALDRKGFRLLLASPSACFKLLKEKEQEGHGEAKMFEGAEFLEDEKPRSITEIMADKFFRNWNEYCQKCIDWNRDILKEELDLTEEDIIDIPQLFSLSANTSSAVAYFPDMVNMIVLGKYLGIPKPFGPIIHGQCCLENEVRRLLEPLGLSCIFIDDYRTYHVFWGNIHCGTNVRRKPFSFKWWNMSP